MLTNEALVWLLFRFLDLFIIGALCAYICIKWLLPVLRKDIEQDKRDKLDQMHSVDSLQSKASSLDEKLIEDDAHIALLEQQVVVWQEACKRKLSKRFAEKKDIEMRLQRYFQRREQEVRQQKVYHAVVPEAIKQAEIKLKETFNEKEGDQFVDALTAFMQKEVE